MEIETIQNLYKNAKLKWSKHCLERMQERDISIDDVKNCIQTGEIIENYPNDFPHPSCLIFGYTINQKILHTIVGSDGETLFFITAYYPSTDKFKGDLNMCMYCKCNELTSSVTTHVVNYKGCVIIIKNVPCDECTQCGERYYSDEVAIQLEKLVNAAKQLMQEISVIDYSSAA